MPEVVTIFIQAKQINYKTKLSLSTSGRSTGEKEV
jgi:hypothetical protein